MPRPRFNIEVAVQMQGESIRRIEAEMKDLSRKVGAESERIRKSVGSIDQQLKNVKSGVKGAAATFILFEGAAAAVESLDRQFGLLNDQTRAMVDGLKQTGVAIRNLDIAGFAAGLGQFLGNAIAQTEENLRVLSGGLHELEQDFERQRNLANILAKEGYDVARMSLEQLEAVMARMLSQRRDIGSAIFGDPKALQQTAEETMRAVTDALQRQGGGGPLNDAQLKNAKEIVQGQLDALAKYGVEAPAILKAVAGAWGVVTTEAEKAGERQRQAAQQAAEAAKRQAEAWQEHLRTQASAQAGDRFEQMVENAKAIEELLDAEMAKRREATEALRQYNTERARKGIVDLGKLREEVEWEEKRVAAIAEGEEALIAWAAAKAAADYAATTNATPEMIAQYEQLQIRLERLKQATNEWAEAQKHILENLVRGVQSSLSGFFRDVFEGEGKNAIEAFGDALKNLLINAVSEWLAAWILAQAKALAASMKRIATEQAAQQGANAAGGAAGGGGGGGMGMGSVLSAGKSLYGAAGWAGIIAGAAVVGLAIWSKYRMDKREAHSFGFGASIGMGIHGQPYVDASVSKQGQQIGAALQGLLAAFQDSVGAYVTGMEKVTIMARNDGKEFTVRIGAESVKTFKSMGEAVLFAFEQAMGSGEFQGNIARGVQEMLQGASERFASPEDFMQAVNVVQSLHNLAAGISELEQAIQRAYPQFEQLEKQLISWGVSASEATRLAGASLVNQLQLWRDEITGRQRTQAEEMALRRQQAAMYDAQVVLVRAELELRRYELQQRLAMLLNRVPLTPGAPAGPTGGTQPGGGTRNTTDQAQAAARATGSIQSQAFRTQVQMYGAWAKATTNITRHSLGSQVTMSVAASQAIDASVQALLDQIAAIDQILANLPDLIGDGPLRAGGGRGRGRGRGGGGGNAYDSGNFWELMLGPNSALGAEQQMALARQRYEQLRAAAQHGGPDARAAFEEFARRYLEEAESFLGHGAQYADIFEQVMRDLSQWGEGNRNEHQARQAAIRSIYDLAGASAAAARQIVELFGGQRRHGGNQAQQAANSNSNHFRMPAGATSLAAGLGAGFGDGMGALAVAGAAAGGGGSSFAAGSSAIVAAVQSGVRAQAQQLERIAAVGERAERRQRRRGRTGPTSGPREEDPAPPPPPPPATGGGGSGRDRLPMGARSAD